LKFKLLVLLLSVSLWADIQRIIPLAPSINEILFALGCGDKIVGNTTYATYPKASQDIEKVGGYFSVSLEKIVSLQPTLVLMQKNNLPLKPKLEKLGIKTEFIKISSLNDIKKGIEKIGALTDTNTKAKAIIDEIEKEMQKTKGILKDKKILIVFGRQFDLKKEIFVSGNSIYFADIIKTSGKPGILSRRHVKMNNSFMRMFVGKVLRTC
jgi:iron complex transport system substrate-binding protein